MSQYRLRVDDHRYAISVDIPLGEDRSAADAHRLAEDMLKAADEAFVRHRDGSLYAEPPAQNDALEPI